MRIRNPTKEIADQLVKGMSEEIVSRLMNVANKEAADEIQMVRFWQAADKLAEELMRTPKHLIERTVQSENYNFTDKSTAKEHIVLCLMEASLKISWENKGKE